MRINPRLAEINGIPLEAHIGKTIAELLPEHAVQAAPHIDRVFQTGLPIEDIEITGETPREPGRQRWWLTGFFPAHHTDGSKLVGVWATEITERKQLELSAQQSNAALAAALRAGRLGVHVYNVREGIIEWDDRVYELWGIATGTPVDIATFESGIYPDDLAHVRATVASALDPTGTRRFHSNFRVINCKTGETKWIHADGDVTFHESRAVKLIGTVQDISERKSQEEKIELLVGELTHRSKNLLAVVQSIARQTRCADATFIDRFTSRLQALARNQDVLIRNSWIGADIGDVAREQIRAFAGDGAHIDGPRLQLGLAASQAISMALHELGTNAVKYGALSAAAGQISFTWSIDGDDFKGQWRETGGPTVKKPAKTGFGSKVTGRLIEHSLSARVATHYHPEGLVWSVQSKLKNLKL